MRRIPHVLIVTVNEPVPFKKYRHTPSFFSVIKALHFGL